MRTRQPPFRLFSNLNRPTPASRPRLRNRGVGQAPLRQPPDGGGSAGLPQGCQAAGSRCRGAARMRTPRRWTSLSPPPPPAGGCATSSPGNGSGRAASSPLSPLTAPASYYFHYLPYAMGGPRPLSAGRLPARPADGGSGLGGPQRVRQHLVSRGGLAAATWRPPAVAIRYEAASEWDSFAPMNFTATAAELKALHGAHEGSRFCSSPRTGGIPSRCRPAAARALGHCGPAAVAAATRRTSVPRCPARTMWCSWACTPG